MSKHSRPCCSCFISELLDLSRWFSSFLILSILVTPTENHSIFNTIYTLLIVLDHTIHWTSSSSISVFTTTIQYIIWHSGEDRRRCFVEVTLTEAPNSYDHQGALFQGWCFAEKSFDKIIASEVLHDWGVQGFLSFPMQNEVQFIQMWTAVRVWLLHLDHLWRDKRTLAAFVWGPANGKMVFYLSKFQTLEKIVSACDSDLGITTTSVIKNTLGTAIL